MKNLQETFTYNSICYTYGYDRQRIFMEEHVGNTTRTKRYVGNCELVTESDGNSTSTHWLTYLTGPTGVYAVVVTQNGTDEIHYILKDNLDSWTAIASSSGVVEQRLSYDAWGTSGTQTPGAETSRELRCSTAASPDTSISTISASST